VEGSLLVVDASQGVEAQTLANVYHALDANHEIVPVLNKIDLPAADIPRVKQQIEDVIGIDASEAVEISAKSGLNIDKVLEAIVERLPAPKGDINAPLKALLVDSWYDTYLGVVVLIRIIDGTVKKGQKIRMMNAQRGRMSSIASACFNTPKLVESRSSAPARSASSPPRSRKWPIPMSATPSPTIKKPTSTPLPGFRPAQPVVFCGLFPVDAS
jgi:GTP-binding protein LepA